MAFSILSLPDSAELMEWEPRGSSPQRIKGVLSMLPVLTIKTTFSIDGIIFDINECVDRQRDADRNGTKRVDRLFPKTDDRDSAGIEEAIDATDDSELGT